MISEREQDEPRQPLLRVVRGDPSPEELAALVTAVTATLAEASAAPVQRAPSAWADPARRLRRPLRHGPGAWRRLGLPS